MSSSTKYHIIIIIGNGSASSSVKKKKRKHRSVADQCIEDSPPVNSHEDDLAQETHPPDQNSESQSSSWAERQDKPKRKTKSKKSHVSDEISTLPADNIEVVEETIPKIQKKKRKKKRQNTSDAETNTSQVINMELVERIIPPPRLEPIKADVRPSTMITPPLRSKFPKEQLHTDLLPPSGASSERRRKHRSIDETITEGEYTAVKMLMLYFRLSVRNSMCY